MNILHHLVSLQEVVMLRSAQAALVLALLFCPTLPAADGDLDTSFWADGRMAFAATIDVTFGGLASSVNGELAVAYSFTPSSTELAYWRAVGDSTVGTACRVDPVPILPMDTRILDARFDALGRLLVLARTTSDIGLQQFYVLAYAFPSCGLVAGYGSGGIATLPGYDLPGFYGNQRLLPLADGKTLVPGWDTDFSHPSAWTRIRVLRLDSNGGVGTTFSAPADTFGTFDAQGVDVAVATNGHVVALAEDANFGASRDFLFIDFAPDGTLLGTVTVAFDAGGADDDPPTAIAPTPDGRIVAVGYAQRHLPDGAAAAIALLHWNATGTFELDPSFDGDGKKAFTFEANPPNQSNLLEDVAVQGDGRILVAGQALGGNWAMAVGRLLLDGSFDADFAPSGSLAGRRIVDFDLESPDRDLAHRLALQNGQVVLGGSVSSGVDVDSIGIARLLNSYVFSDGFDSLEFTGWTFSPGIP